MVARPHERCVRDVKASYSAIVVCLGHIHLYHIYTDSHECEALKYFPRYQLLQLFRQKALNCQWFSVDTTLSSLNDILLPVANWVLELKEDNGQEIEQNHINRHIYL